MIYKPRAGQKRYAVFARFYERCTDRTELAVGSLLTSSQITDWMYSATARHEHGAKRSANGHRGIWNAILRGMNPVSIGTASMEGRFSF